MDIWLIQDGEKTGPLHDFEVRRKIESGELHPDTPAWHEGLSRWMPLAEIELFAREFERSAKSGETPSAPDLAESPAALSAPTSAYPIRRFWARWFDLCLYAALWWLAMWAAGRDIGAILRNSWIILLHYVPWFAFEAWLVHRFGTTPGKWLLGLRVVNNDGSPLSLTESIRRSARVLFIGLGFGWFLLTIICQLMAFFTCRRLGRPLWDYAGGHQVAVEPLKPMRVVTFVIVMFAALQLQALVVSPYVMEELEKQYPGFKEKIGAGQAWNAPAPGTDPPARQ